MQGGKLMEMGQLTTLDHDGTKTEYPFALLIEFKSAEDCRRAIAEERCRFAFGDYPADTPASGTSVPLLRQTLRRIRACEGEVAAQILLEWYVSKEVAAEREACAQLCENSNVYNEDDPGEFFAVMIRRRSSQPT